MRLSDSIQALCNFDAMVAEAHKRTSKRDKERSVVKDLSYYEEDFLDDEDELGFQRIERRPSRHSSKQPRIKKDNFRKQKQAKQKERKVIEQNSQIFDEE